MSWNRGGITGSNNIPLGNKRRFGDDAGGAPDDGGYNPSAPATGLSELSAKRGRSPVRTVEHVDADGGRRRPKRNRWGSASDNKAAGLMGLPTLIQGPMTEEQKDAYAKIFRIQEITEKLRINDVLPSGPARSRSPPPQYDQQGRRTNTREIRHRKKLEDERHELVEDALRTVPDYHPPTDYKRPAKTQEKVYVPVNDYPEINFIGLLIGPRGNTLKKMEAESGAKIAIRGKGSVKEGKGRSDAAHNSNQDEDLHCLIMADTEEKVNKAKQLIHGIIETAASIPEGQNELKRNQLRELAALNGTLRDDENQACANCGKIGHRKFDCPEAQNQTATIICRFCGGAGHMARDCQDRTRGQEWRNNDRGGFNNDRGGYNDGGRAPAGHIGPAGNADNDYEALMRELGGGAPMNGGQAPQRIESGPQRMDSGPPPRGYANDNYGGDEPARELKPWQRGPTGAPAPWAQRGGRDDRDGPSSGRGAPPPWASAGGGRGNDSYGGYGGGGYNAPPAPPGAAPWQQPAAPPPPAHQYGGYGGYGASGYEQSAPGYGQAPGMAPPGVTAPPPGLGPLFQTVYGNAGSAPPPPPGDAPPPPPPSDLPPPPPPA